MAVELPFEVVDLVFRCSLMLAFAGLGAIARVGNVVHRSVRGTFELGLSSFCLGRRRIG